MPIPMQGLANKRNIATDSVYVRLFCSSKDAEMAKRCPLFLASKNKEPIGEFNQVSGFIQNMKVRVKETDNGPEDIIQLSIYNDVDDTTYTVESSFNNVMKSIICKLASLDLENTSVTLSLFRNKNGYAGGTVLDSEGNNIPFTDEYHPKAIADAIYKEIDETASADVKEDQEVFKKVYYRKSDKFYRNWILTLSEQFGNKPQPEETAEPQREEIDPSALPF